MGRPSASPCPLTLTRAARPASSRAVGGSGKRILVVDDEPDIAYLIRRYLERAGYRVIVAHNGHDALERARRETPDLITLDILLPDANGLTVLEWLKNDSRTAGIPVVMLSIIADNGSVRLGAVDYLLKPVDESALIRRVSEMLNPGRLVLVADDDPDIRGLIANRLRHAGYRVVEAGDGEAAIDLAKRDQPDLALLDVMMPYTDGIGVLREIRADSRIRETPVIMMTASPALYDENRTALASLGAGALLSKPFTIEDLAEAISSGLTADAPSDEIAADVPSNGLEPDAPSNGRAADVSAG